MITQQALEGTDISTPKCQGGSLKPPSVSITRHLGSITELGGLAYGGAWKMRTRWMQMESETTGGSPLWADYSSHPQLTWAFTELTVMVVVV